MGNYVLGYHDIGYNAVFSGGVWRDDLTPSAMLTRPLLTAVARTLDLSELVLDVTLQESIDIQVVGICNHNMSINATYQWQCFSDVDRLNLVYDSGVIAAYAYFDALIHNTTCDALDAPITDIFWRLTINDSNTDGFIEIGRLFMGQRFITEQNMEYGLNIGVDTTNSQMEQSTVGIEAFVQSVKKRTATFSHILTSRDEGTEHLKYQIREGVSQACLFEFDPDNKDEGVRTFIGRNESLSPLDYPQFNVNNYGFNIREII